MTRYIKCHVEFVLPVPSDIVEELDAVAEAGLGILRSLIAEKLTRVQPGTLHTSWQSMPKSWAPKRSNVVLAEPISPALTHTVDANDRIGFIEEQGVMHPWDQGLSIFPEGHPLRSMEDMYRRQYDDPRYKAQRGEIKGAALELGAGNDDDE